MAVAPAKIKPGLEINRPYRYLTEAFFWVAGLILLAFLDPAAPHLFSLCPFSWVLPDGCPGCGLGHAIAFLYRGQWLASWEAHPLAGPAVFLLLGRIYQLGKNYYTIRLYNLQLKK